MPQLDAQHLERRHEEHESDDDRYQVTQAIGHGSCEVSRAAQGLEYTRRLETLDRTLRAS
jgi:hypothetical protein